MKLVEIITRMGGIINRGEEIINCGDYIINCGDYEISEWRVFANRNFHKDQIV